jgi:hypothetical protein
MPRPRRRPKITILIIQNGPWLLADPHCPKFIARDAHNRGQTACEATGLRPAVN